MPKTAKKIVLIVAAFIVVVFAVFLFNQTIQIVQSARAVNPVFGNGVLWGLIFTYLHSTDDSVCALVPITETDAAAPLLSALGFWLDLSAGGPALDERLVDDHLRRDKP
jgi:hypothetical protein